MLGPHRGRLDIGPRGVDVYISHGRGIVFVELTDAEWD
jgi:hypothetical protein